MQESIGVKNINSKYILPIVFISGYGNIAPCTDLSRGITTIYASLGVPLMILVLADLGKLFTKVMKFGFFYVRRFYRTGTFFHMKDTEISDKKPLQVS